MPPRPALPAFALLGVVTLAASALASCAHRTQGRIITAADLAEPSRTLLTNYLDAPRRFLQPTERTPEGVPRSALADEAVIVKLAGAEACFDVVARTEAELDTPLPGWELTVNDARVHVSNETAAVREWPRADGKPYRTVERRARVCAIDWNPNLARLELALVLPQDDGRGDWGETFTWELR